jgi:hypothetical protein
VKPHARHITLAIIIGIVLLMLATVLARALIG